MRIRPRDRSTWQRWFAWHPVIVDNVTVWLETVERKRHPDIFDWVYGYRMLDKSDRRKRLRAWLAAAWPRRRGRSKLRDGWGA